MPDLAVRQHRLIGLDLTLTGLAGYVLVGEHGTHPAHRQRGSHVQAHEAGSGRPGATGGAPQHALRVQVRGEGEVTRHFGDAVGADDGLPHAAAYLASGDGGRAHNSPSPENDCIARKMAP